jgi:two-component system, NtrC family, response regulator HydG
LRKRGNDVLMLAEHFKKVYCSKYFKADLELEDKAKEKLLSYHFPGNVRELQYTIERAVIMADGNTLGANDLLFSPIENNSVAREEPDELNLGAMEKNAIMRVIDKHNGNISKAARELGLTRTALYRRLSKYDI